MDWHAHDLALNSDVDASAGGAGAVRAGVRGGKKKQRVQALGAALAIAACAAKTAPDVQWRNVGAVSVMIHSRQFQ